MTSLKNIKRDNFIWTDGKMIPWKDATIHVASHGLHYATTALEGVQIYNKKPFLLSEHVQRFFESAEVFQIKIPYTQDEICNVVHEVINKNKIGNGYIRLIAWLGNESLKLASNELSSHISIISLPLNKICEASMQSTSGLRVMVSSWIKPINRSSAPISLKSSATYTLSILAKNEAKAKGCHDALLLDYQGYLSEMTTSNIFLAIDGDLHTPIPDFSMNGLTRQIIMQEASNSKISVIERKIHLDEIKTAEEIFIVGTCSEIVPIREILNIGEFPYGAITQKLQRCYKTLTES